MKKLYLLRHAKSDHNHRIDDHERSINERGRSACLQVVDYIKAEGITPDLILSSSSRRTKETATILIEEVYPDIKLRLSDRLYLATAGEIIRSINMLEDSCKSVMLVGHNPGLHECTVLLAGDGSDKEALLRIEQGFPTAALVIVECDIANWQELEPGRGRLLNVFVPSKSE